MKRFFSFILAFTILIAIPLYGAQFFGGKGMIHTNSALLLPPGALDVSLYVRGTMMKPDNQDYLASNGTSALSATFGFTRRAELGFTQVLYQDVNDTPRGGDPTTVLIPGDTYIRFKLGGYNIANNLFFSYIPALRYRVAKFHNVHLEPYQSEAVEAELLTAWSWFWKPLYPDEDKSLHLNLGLINHNDMETITESSMQITYLLSFKYPKRIFDFGFELYGGAFIKRPPVSVLGREDWMYITPMVTYKPFKGLNFSTGLDVLLMGSKDTSVPEIRDAKNFPNYPNWRLSGRISFAPSTAFYVAPTFAKTTDAAGGYERRKGVRSSGGNEFLDRQSLFKWAIEDQMGGVEAIDLDLEKLRQERIRAEEDLKRLKKKLEQKQRESTGK